MRIIYCMAAVFSIGCKPELPALEYRGGRVNVGTDVVEQVCQGTLTRMDREVEQIESRLDIPIQSSRIDVYIVDNDSIETHCEAKVGGCSPTLEGRPSVVIGTAGFERGIAHELVHARLYTRSIPLFVEGMAEAASRPSCPRQPPDIDLGVILAAKNAVDWPDRRDTYYAAGELIAWLLVEFGPDEVIQIMRSVKRGSAPEVVRVKYLEHFGRDLASDFLAHRRTNADLDALPSEHFGCFAEPVDPSHGPVSLSAELDCQSESVHNLFGLDGRGYVEWTMNVDHEQTLTIEGEVPVGTGFSIEECGCQTKIGDQSRLSRPFDESETLKPGVYRLRWVGALDEGLSLDVELMPL
jgi:hypothetical protein